MVSYHNPSTSHMVRIAEGDLESLRVSNRKGSHFDRDSNGSSGPQSVNLTSWQKLSKEQQEQLCETVSALAVQQLAKLYTITN
jgi:hypothetical protein